MCHVNIQTPIGNSVQSDKDFNATLAIEYRTIERYRAALILSELGLQDKLRHSSGGKPPVIFMDRATIPTNKLITPRDLIHRLDDGFEACAKDCSVHSADLSYRDVAFAIGMNAMCQEDKQWLSEGSFYFRPSRASAALFATILHLSNQSMLKSATGDLAFKTGTTLPHHMRVLTRALDLMFSEDVGDLEVDLQSICERPDSWQRSAEDSKSSTARPVHILDRIIRPELTAEKSEGVGVRAVFISANKCIKGNAETGHEPLYLSVMPPRWLAGPACPWHLLGNDTTHVWHPSDFGAHFKGCEGVGHFTDLWRAAVSEDTLPWLDEDEDWSLWRSQGVPYWETDRSGHLNYLLSPACPSA